MPMLAAALAFALLAQDSLTNLKKLQCTFAVQATGTWTDGVPKAEIKPAKLAVAFDNIDVGGGTADTIGQFGPLHIIVRLTGSTIHFLHIDTGGALYLTTVFVHGEGVFAGRQTARGPYPARVHGSLPAWIHVTARAVLRRVHGELLRRA